MVQNPIPAGHDRILLRHRRLQEYAGGDAETQAAWAVLDCRPTTLAGALHLACYTASVDREGITWPEYRDHERENPPVDAPSWAERVMAKSRTPSAITKPKPVREGDVISGASPPSIWPLRFTIISTTWAT